MTEIKDKIFDDILPNYPQKLLLNHFIKAIIKKDLGSFLMTLLQLSKRHFNMERHLDSDMIMQLCQDENLLEKLTAHLGENILLWRSEIWVNYPAKQMIPYWHQDVYPNLVKGKSKNIYAYIALTEVNEHNGFEYIPNIYQEHFRIKITDPFSGNNLFEIPEEIKKIAIPVVLKPGEFVLFTDELMHCSLHNHSGKIRMSLALRFTPSGTEVVQGYTSNYHQPVTLQLKK
ncbi:phytanoyl-CoA dioxygenase family protein [Brunnivagina elsteri]|nr:phytanoyl-CoA dioxygenase family protein [Calothrix elsteri]